MIDLYSNLYSTSKSSVSIPRAYRKYSSVTVNEIQLETHGSRSRSSSIVMAKWESSLFGSCNTTIRAARIDYFCMHSLTLENQTKQTVLAGLSWFKFHPQNTKFGKPTTVWYHDLFESDGLHSLVPISFISCRCVSLIDILDGESVLFVCPCVNY